MMFDFRNGFCRNHKLYHTKTHTDITLFFFKLNQKAHSQFGAVYTTLMYIGCIPDGKLSFLNLQIIKSVELNSFLVKNSTNEREPSRHRPHAWPKFTESNLRLLGKESIATNNVYKAQYGFESSILHGYLLVLSAFLPQYL